MVERFIYSIEMMQDREGFRGEELIKIGLILFACFIIGFGFIKVGNKLQMSMVDVEIEQIEAGLNIVNITNKLPHKTLTTRDVEGVTMIIIHHTERESKIINIANYHVNNNKWSTIGYHFIIQKSGKVVQVNDIETLSPHARNVNMKSIGICFNGNFEKNEPTKESIEACYLLIKKLRNEYPNIKVVKGHCDVGATKCPGVNLIKYLDKFNN